MAPFDIAEPAEKPAEPETAVEVNRAASGAGTKKDELPVIPDFLKPKPQKPVSRDSFCVMFFPFQLISLFHHVKDEHGDYSLSSVCL